MIRSFSKTINGALWWLLTYFFLLLTGSAAWLYAMLFLKLTVKGQDNIPENRQGLILAANHQTFVDSWFIGTFMKRFSYLFLYPRILPWNIPEFKNFYRTWLLRVIFKHLRCIPVKRGKMTLGETKFFLSEVRKTLLRYNLLLFFEGTRSRNGQIGAAKEGVGNIIHNNPHCLVVPVRIRGFDQVWPVDKNWFKALFWQPMKNCFRGQGKTIVSIVFGQPLDLSDSFEQRGNQRGSKEEYKGIEQKIKEAVEGL